MPFVTCQSSLNFQHALTAVFSIFNIFEIWLRIDLFSSRRAKRAGWPKGLKDPEGTFRPFGPAGVLRRRLLHRNGNFVPLAP